MIRARIAVLTAIVIGALLVTASPAISEVPSNDLFAGAVEIDPGALPFTDSRDTTEATTDPNDEAAALCQNDPPATDATVWYSITPTSDAVMQASTAGTNYSSGVIVLTGSPGSFAAVACSGFRVATPVEAGVTYYLMVIDDQLDGEGNGGQLELEVNIADGFCDGQPATIVGSGLIKGTSGDDVIVGSAGPDRIFGFAGNDILCGEGGNDLIDGGPGDDLALGDSPFDMPPFAESNGDNNDTLRGGAGNDTLVGFGGDDLISGNGGNDFLIGQGGADTMHGGAGNDTMFGGPLDDRMHGEGGDDNMFGNFGSDLLNGGAGNDFLDGDNGELPPNPPFSPGGNDDLCLGGVGNNTFENCEEVAHPGT